MLKKRERIILGMFFAIGISILVYAGFFTNLLTPTGFVTDAGEYPTKPACVDSDGLNYGVIGTTSGWEFGTDNWTVYTDTCSGTNLQEGYCEAGGTVAKSLVACQNGADCSMGTCEKFCEISTDETCAGYFSVMTLFADTNTHGNLFGETAGQTYGLCCNFIGTNTCTGTNKVLGLSSATNAHAEINGQDIYLDANDVCFGDLECVGTTTPDLVTYPIKMVSLSSATNAHIGGYDNYTYKVVCKASDPSCNNDGVCDVGENVFNCEDDCGRCYVDGVCDIGENSTTCPADCTNPCGDGYCGEGELETCPSDCSSDAYWAYDDPAVKISKFNMLYDGSFNFMMLVNNSGLDYASANFQVWETDSFGGVTEYAGLDKDVTAYISESVVCPSTGACGPEYVANQLTLNSTLFDYVNDGTEPDKRYEFYFIVNDNDVYKSGVFTVNVLDSPGPRSYWMDYTPTNIIDEIEYNSSAGPMNVTMVLNNSGLTRGDITIEVWDADASEGGSDSLISSTTTYAYLDEDPIQDVLTINDQLIADAGVEADNVTELYLNISNGTTNWVSGYLRIYIVGEAGAYVPGAGELRAYWTDVYGEEITEFIWELGNTEEVVLVINNSGLLVGENMTVEIEEYDLIPPDDSIKFVNVTGIANGMAIKLWKIDEMDLQEGESGISKFYFTNGTFESSQLWVTIREDVIDDTCLTTFTCSDYINSGNCTVDECGVSDVSMNNNNPGIDCAADDWDCLCKWDSSTSTCGPSWDAIDFASGTEIGTCDYLEDFSGGDCTDSEYLRYSWDINWEWDPTNTGLVSSGGAGYVQDPIDSLWYYDPNNASLECNSGFNTILCPAKIQLSFFNLVNLVAALAIVFVIYYLVQANKKKKVKKKASKKKAVKKKVLKK